MDEKGDVLVTQGARSVAGFEATLGKLTRLMDLRAKAATGDAGAQIDLALAEGDLDLIPFEEVQKRIEGKKLTDAQKAMLAEVEYGSMIASIYKATDKAAQQELAKKIADCFVAGRLPTDAGRKQAFYQVTLSYAMNEGDPDLAQKALDVLRPMLEQEHGKDNPQLQNSFRRVEDKIAEMREAQKEGCGADEGIEEGCGEESEKDK
jgi:hypothetical protein